MKKESLFFLSILIFCTCSFGLYFLTAHKDAHLDLDSQGYDEIAHQFAQKNQLINPERGSVIPVQTLGYPLFMGMIYKIFGDHFGYIILMQVLLSLCALLLLYRIALMLFDEQVALVAFFFGSFKL